MTLILYLRAWGKMIHEKKPEANNPVILSLEVARQKSRKSAAIVLDSYITQRSKSRATTLIGIFYQLSSRRGQGSMLFTVM
jgi:hypothetical protein